MQKIIFAAGLGAATAHLESAEWVPPDDRAGAGAIDVNIPGFDLRSGALDVGWTAREKSGGERVIGAVRDLDCFIEIARSQNAENRSENFFASNAHVRLHIDKDCRRNEVPF